MYCILCFSQVATLSISVVLFTLHSYSHGGTRRMMRKAGNFRPHSLAGNFTASEASFTSAIALQCYSTLISSALIFQHILPRFNFIPSDLAIVVARGTATFRNVIELLTDFGVEGNGIGLSDPQLTLWGPSTATSVGSGAQPSWKRIRCIIDFKTWQLVREFLKPIIWRPVARRDMCSTVCRLQHISTVSNMPMLSAVKTTVLPASSHRQFRMMHSTGSLPITTNQAHGRATMTTKVGTNGATELLRMNLSEYVGHVTTFRWMFTIPCYLVVGLGLGLGLDLVSGW